MKRTGVVPPEHYSHDHLNEQREVPIEKERLDRLRETFARIQRERAAAGEKIVWVIVDGFLLYWHKVRCPPAFLPSVYALVYARANPQVVVPQGRPTRARSAIYTLY